MEQKRYPIFSERFAQLRGEQTQAEFSDFLGISRPTVGFYENGTRIPDALVLRQIAERCNVSADWLLGLSENPSRDPDISNACNYTGLNEDVVERFNKTKYAAINEDGEFFSFLNKLFSDQWYRYMISNLFDCSQAIEAECVRFLLWEKIWHEEAVDKDVHDDKIYEEVGNRTKLRFDDEVQSLCNDTTCSKRVRELIAIHNYLYSDKSTTNPIKGLLFGREHFRPYDLYKNRATEYFNLLFSAMEDKLNELERRKE